MQEPRKDGFFRIPLVGVEGEDLTSLMEAELPQDARIEARSRTPGVHMDAATAQIVVPAISSAVVSIIGAIATIWAAKVNSRAKPAAAPPPPAIEIETLTTSVVIPIDGGLEAALRGAIPVSTKSILAVRLLTRAPEA